MGSSSEGSQGPLSEPGPRTPDPGLPDEAPPFGRSWHSLYAVVAGTLIVLIAVFYAFTVAFR